MNKILLVLSREYLVRVRKRTFLLTTLLTPIIFAALFVVPILLARGLEKTKTVEVIDETNQIFDDLQGGDKLTFVKAEKNSLEEAKKGLEDSDIYAIMYIPKMDFDNPKEIELVAKKSISFELKREITGKVEKVIEDIKFVNSGIDKKVLDSIETDVTINTSDLTGKESSSEAAFAIGILVAFVIYMSVLLYAQQVMRGVVEEKTNRIIEVLISSLKPFQLMMGKILGIAGVAMTQFILWILLTYGILTGVVSFFNIDEMAQANTEQIEAKVEEGDPVAEAQQEQTQMVQTLYNRFSTIPLFNTIASFLFYFLGGYLLYSAMFAAAASGADNDADTQQLVLPLSAPLIITFVALQAILSDPDGTVAFWLSIIPFTSPIAMMLRIPFGGVAAWEQILSMVLLVLGFIAITWIAGRIYRIGILMYGKKVTFKELGKWIFYKG